MRASTITSSELSGIEAGTWCGPCIGSGCDLVFGDGLIFTLPIGYRPAKVALFSTITNEQLGRVDVSPTGEVIVGAGTPNMTTNMKAWLSLEGMTFRPAP